MNIQIFGSKKCFESKKAERYFKERRIKVQNIDILDKGMSAGELKSVITAMKGIDNILNENAKDSDTLNLIKYLADEQKFEKLLENQQIIKTPVVRNGQKATVGYCPDVWKGWE